MGDDDLVLPILRPIYLGFTDLVFSLMPIEHGYRAVPLEANSDYTRKQRQNGATLR
jgi:hypothetical protein